MAAIVNRSFIVANGRSVHYHHAGPAGDAPPLILCHQSPKTSEELVPLLQDWGRYFHCYAPDSAGYGLSDPMPGKALALADLADSVADFMDALGLETAVIYGIHTGAKIALGTAERHPDRVAGVVANGVLVNTPADRQDLADRYLPPFKPSIDGAHMAMAWHRMRDQRVFFPWYDRRDAARMPIDVSAPDDLQASVMDLFAAGDTYGAGYGAALSLNTRALLARLTVPALITCGPGDVLLEHLKNISAPDCVTVRGADSDAALKTMAADFLKTHAPGATSPQAQPPAHGRRLRPTLRGEAGARCHGLMGGHRAPDARRILVLPDLGGSVFTLRDVLEPLASDMQILGLDPTGFGWSDADGGDPVAALDAAVGDFAPDAVVAHGLSAALALDWLAATDAPAKKLVLLDAVFPDDSLRPDIAAGLIPDLTPQAAGGHLLAAWQAVRESALFYPWFRPVHAAAIPSDGKLVTGPLQQAAVALLRGWRTAQSLLPTALDAPSRLAGGGLDTVALVPDWSQGRGGLAALPAPVSCHPVAHADRPGALRKALLS